MMSKKGWKRVEIQGERRFEKNVESVSMYPLCVGTLKIINCQLSLYVFMGGC